MSSEGTEVGSRKALVLFLTPKNRMVFCKGRTVSTPETAISVSLNKLYIWRNAAQIVLFCN